MHSTNFNKLHFHIYLKYFKESRDFFLWFMSYVEMCNWFPKYFSVFKLSQLLITSSLVSREGNGNPPQFSCLENPMGEGAWWAAVHGVMESWTRLSDFTFTFHFHALEKEMAAHSSVLAWRIPGTGEPGGLPSVGLHRVGHDWAT